MFDCGFNCYLLTFNSLSLSSFFSVSKCFKVFTNPRKNKYSRIASSNAVIPPAISTLSRDLSVMDSSITWSCEQCSTINRASASKCSSCGTVKNCELSRKSPGSCVGRKYRSRPAIVTQHISAYTTIIDDSVTQDNRQLESATKWTCISCSYKNWPNATKCVMCNKRRNSANLSRSTEDVIGAVGGPANIEQSICEEQSKWKCSRCTYENWPRSSKCTICRSSKPTSPPLTPLISAVASEEGSSLSQCSVDINELQTKVQLLSISDKFKQIRNKMNETDWLFLNACVGVVNNDFSAVQPYIQATGGYVSIVCVSW